MLKTTLHHLNKIKDNTFIMQSINTMILRVIGIITLFGFTMFLTHNYDPKIVGQYDFIRTFLLVVGSVCLIGTDQSILYFAGIIKSRGSIEDLKKVYLRVVLMIFGISILFFLLILILGKENVGYFLRDDKIYTIIFKATTIIFFYCLTLFNTETYRALESVYIAELYRNTFKYISVIIGAIVLLRIHEESYLVDSFLIGFILLSFISTIGVFKAFKKRAKDGVKERIPPSMIIYKSIFIKSYPMAISGMAIFLLMSIDITLLKRYKGDSYVAFYSLAIKLMTILSMIINSINITISTKIAEYFISNNKEELKKTIRNSNRFIFLLTFPLMIFICFFSETILEVFGSSYIEAKSTLIILVIGQGVCSFFGAAPIYLNMTGRQQLFQFILILAVVINLILNILLIPTYGMLGAGISFVISMIFWNVLAAIIVYKKDKVKLFLN